MSSENQGTNRPVPPEWQENVEKAGITSDEFWENFNDISGGEIGIFSPSGSSLAITRPDTYGTWSRPVRTSRTIADEEEEQIAAETGELTEIQELAARSCEQDQLNAEARTRRARLVALMKQK